MNVNTLERLDDEEFLDELGEHLGWDDPDWATFNDTAVVRRTGEALEIMAVKVEQQLRAREDDTTPENLLWQKRAKNWESLVAVRLRHVRRAIHALDTHEQANAKAWKIFAHKLVDIVDDSDLSAALDDLYIPIGGLNARQWRDRRNEKRAEVRQTGALRALDAGVGAEQYLVMRDAA